MNDNPAATIRSAQVTVSLNDDELLCVNYMHRTLSRYRKGSGRLLTEGGHLGPEEADDIRALCVDVVARLNDPLVVYVHGHGNGTVMDGSPFYDLIKRFKVHYRKTVARYKKGRKGVLDNYEDVVMRSGRTVKNQRADCLKDVTPLVSALSKLESVTKSACSEGLEVSLRDAYEFL